MKYLRRLVWYLATRASIGFLLLALMVLAFYYAMNAANIYIVLKDGMAQRASVVLMNEPSDKLTRYFSSSFITVDEKLTQQAAGQSPYKGYAITGFDHRVNMTWMWCWPWENTAVALIREDIPAIDGRATAETREAAAITEDDTLLSVPAWNGGTYRAVLERVGGRWQLKTLTPRNP